MRYILSDSIRNDHGGGPYDMAGEGRYVEEEEIAAVNEAVTKSGPPQSG